jgi:RNA polymerase sigma-70 factor (ECF subfamily)
MFHRDAIPAGYERQWLGRVAANKAKDHLQSAWSRRTVMPGGEELPRVCLPGGGDWPEPGLRRRDSG